MTEVQAIKWMREWAQENGFDFVNCDEAGIRLPCALHRDYVPNDQTLFVKGFLEGRSSGGISYGGLECKMKFRCLVEDLNQETIKNFLPKKTVCARCNKKNLNLRTDDGHKTYVCSACHSDAKKIKLETD